MLAQYPIESASSNCCINRRLPLFFNALCSSLLTFSISCSPLAVLSPRHNLPHICHLPPYPHTFLSHPSKDTSSGSLSSSCWHKFEAHLYGPLTNTQHTLTWPRAKAWWSRVELNWWSILWHLTCVCFCLCVCLFHKNANTHTYARICSQTNLNLLECGCSRQAHKARWQLEGWAEGVREVAYDSDTKALVFSWRRLYHTLGCCCIGLPLSWGNHGNRLLGDSGARVSGLESVGLQLLNTKRD